MKLAASTGITLKEAWAQVKAGAPSKKGAEEGDAEGEAVLSAMKQKEEAF